MADSKREERLNGVVHGKEPEKIKIGTSGIVVPGTKLTFPDEFKDKTRLHYYSSLFNTLEINSSFYKIPLASTFAKWSTQVPAEFKFTVKLWREITHAKKLSFDPNDINLFMEAANHLGTNIGCLLIQFPASITFHYVLEVVSILQHVQLSNKNNHWQIAVELRHSSWYQEAAYRLFKKYKISLVIHDMPGSKTPLDFLSTNLIYCRFHGPAGDYKGSYSNEFLHDQAKRIKAWRKEGRGVYVYFNNTMEGALDNAQLLQKLVSD